MTLVLDNVKDKQCLQQRICCYAHYMMENLYVVDIFLMSSDILLSEICFDLFYGRKIECFI